MKTIKLAGILVQGDADYSTQVFSVMLLSDDGKIYQLKEQHTELQLEAFLRCRARIRGHVDVSGVSTSIRIEQFELLDH